ncbi:molybdenum ABC transporter ATP-binding protein [Arthrobacter sp. Soil736]|uniref:sulfate/molybdate ABC transporter ATP-binding protein n=1 Tax=Arthrobacter sp. Soil736 TaxID=1736395 RepID=UPI0006FD4873|nr:ATP-binding cassette domain-containing protein [Arthrobacter sp. Soil736]KRE67515.1 molybdenum ABC transporter ATP-binding protein [Arthrobacter sp. Soil736]
MTFRLEAAVEARGFDVSLSVGPAETVAIMGPNGAGKSTLLAVIAGLLHPDSGRAEVDGRVLFDRAGGRSAWTAPHQRGTALLAQEPLLFPHLTVLENVAFGPRSKGTPRRDAREAARRWLGAVDAGELAARRPAELSGGQAQRVAVARALAADPQLLLLDEPMAALDIHAAPLLRRLLKQVLAERRAIIITHDVLDALMLADRVIVLEDGKVTESGPTREVLQRPRSRFVAGLAGLNLVAGTLTERGVRTAAGQEFAGQHDSAMEAGAFIAGQAGVAVFPPSAVSVFLTEAHGSPRNSFPVAVTDLEPHGDQIRVRAGDLSADITPAASADLGLSPGMTVFFVIKAGAVSVYPA